MGIGFQIGDLLSRKDPQPTWRWVVTTGTKVLPFGLPASYVESIDVPFLNVQVQSPVFVAGGFVYFPGFHDIAAFGMTFYEDEDGTTLRWIQAWKNRIKNFTSGDMGLPSEYKRDIPVSLLDNTGSVKVSILLKGCWPSDTGNIPLSYTDENGRLTYSQTFSIDDQTITFR